MYPSVKSLMMIKDVTAEDARAIRAIMAGPHHVLQPCTFDDPARQWNPIACEWVRPVTRLQQIDTILRTFGVEYIPAGHNAKSPAIYYCNTGDTYDTTVLKVRGRFRVGCWGDIVERGKYD